MPTDLVPVEGRVLVTVEMIPVLVAGTILVTVDQGALVTVDRRILVTIVVIWVVALEVLASPLDIRIFLLEIRMITLRIRVIALGIRVTTLRILAMRNLPDRPFFVAFPAAAIVVRIRWVNDVLQWLTR